MSMTLNWCKVCDRGSLEGFPTMVMCSKCYLEFHLHCAIEGDELPEDTEGGTEVDPKHCPRCRGEYVDPEVKAAADMWCRTIVAAKVRRLTFEIFEPIEELGTTDLELRIPTVKQVDPRVLATLLAGKYRILLGYRETRLGDKDLGKTLDEKTAKRFLKKPDDVDLSEYAYLKPEAAKVLAKCQGDLWLEGLTELTNQVAEALAKHDVGFLYLIGLAEMTDKTAEALAKHQGGLDLGGLTELSDTAAEALAKHQGELSLYGLTELSDTAAEALAKHQGHLRLGGLTELSDKAAEALAKHQGKLYLYSLKVLSPRGARALLKHGNVDVDDDVIDLKALA